MILIQSGHCAAAQALEKIDGLFSPAVSFRALTCAPLGSRPEDFPDTQEVYRRLTEVAELVGGNAPEIMLNAAGQVTHIEYESRTGNTVFIWDVANHGYYEVCAADRHSTLLYNALLAGGVVTDLIYAPCCVYPPGHPKNPSSDRWLYVEGKDCHYHDTLSDLLEAEAGGWTKVAPFGA